eukprot:1116817-Rhodomonas_salina.2
MVGTDLAYAATRSKLLSKFIITIVPYAWSAPLCAYAPAMRCPVLLRRCSRVVLNGTDLAVNSEPSGTDLAVGLSGTDFGSWYYPVLIWRMALRGTDLAHGTTTRERFQARAPMHPARSRITYWQAQYHLNKAELDAAQVPNHIQNPHNPGTVCTSRQCRNDVTFCLHSRRAVPDSMDNVRAEAV